MNQKVTITHPMIIIDGIIQPHDIGGLVMV
jgi:hypothetical protein